MPMIFTNVMTTPVKKPKIPPTIGAMVRVLALSGIIFGQNFFGRGMRVRSVHITASLSKKSNLNLSSRSSPSNLFEYSSNLSLIKSTCPFFSDADLTDIWAPKCGDFIIYHCYMYLCGQKWRNQRKIALHRTFPPKELFLLITKIHPMYYTYSSNFKSRR